MPCLRKAQIGSALLIATCAAAPVAADNHQTQQPTPVGQAPAETQQSKPQVEGLADIGGVLTPAGKLILEPALQYSHSDVNRLTFRGIEILSSLGIGLLEAVDADRDSVIASLTGRLGLTNRLELEVKVPYLYRDDEETVAIPQVDDSNISNKLYGDGMGDIEIALHYQLNGGQNGWPFFIANARAKLNNGDGPFDVPRTAEGIETELATGSGFYSYEPSITMLFPSAPAVFFSNLGYLFNIEDTINKTFAEQTIGKVDPGDAVRFSFGMAYSVNERASFTLGFKTDFIQGSDSEINGETFSSSNLTIGSMLMGWSYQLTPNTGINLNLELGVTDDAPNMLMTFRVPVAVGTLWR
ncbi:transporter [Marinobacter sp. X15-166B]|uniref:transporter n=1 Tax=Marinobacter sp. X15-166B TaxID=1897620 RepID=UPI00085BEB76|nr:transporter [Marinobacter sp. X15-166B]OEY65105.1 hypothetical protein BG841_00560 [Marinobacter sp. X15-166B]